MKVAARRLPQRRSPPPGFPRLAERRLPQPRRPFFSNDQVSGLPKNWINHVIRGGFYGNMWGYHDVTDPSDSAMAPPVCWITNEMDRSPAEPVWVTSGKVGPAEGVPAAEETSHTAWARCSVVPSRDRRRRGAGGRLRTPGRVVPDRRDARPGPPGRRPPLRLGALRLGGQPRPTRRGSVPPRYTGKPVHVPVGLHARKDMRARAHLQRPSRSCDRLRSRAFFRLRPGHSGGRRITAPSITTSERSRSMPRACRMTRVPFPCRSPASGRPSAWKSSTTSKARPASRSEAAFTTRSITWAIELRCVRSTRPAPLR